MSRLVQQLVGGAAVFGGAAWGGYTIASAAKQRPTVTDSSVAAQDPAAADGACSCSSACAFDRLAGVYDGIVGAEEAGMLMGLLRWWLLRGVQGNVLEISAGTGRNLPHYPLGSGSITSLTLTDVSAPMLAVARDKYFDELQLQYQQPDLTCSFLLADAQRMVAAPGEAPARVLLPAQLPAKQQPQQQRVDGASGGGTAPTTAGATHRQEQQQVQVLETKQEGGGGVWRFKQHQRQQQQPHQPGALAPQAAPAAAPAAAAPSAAADRRPDNGGTAPAAASPPPPSSSSGSRGWRWSGKGAAGADKATTSSSDSSRDSASSSCTISSSSSSSSSSSGPRDLSTFAPGSFDAVVDTFGLCSCNDPVQVLRQAAALLRPGGRLLLLEHGRSTWAWLNEHMDARAAKHYAAYGCWYNRDIMGAVQQAGLVLESVSRWHFGTTCLIVATAPPGGDGVAQQQDQQDHHAVAPAAAARAA